MKITKVLVILFILMMGTAFVNKNLSYAQKQVDLFDEILSKTNSKTVEYGLKASFETNEDGEESCLALLKSLKLNDNSQINVLRDEKNYCLEFNKDNLSGYIESINYDNHSIITINISEKNNKNELANLKEKVNKAINRNDEKIKYFQYLKAQITNSNLGEVNKDIVKILKEQNASNIETISLENGYSTVAYTKRYDIMKNNNKWMDFNYALCSYTSGNYLIIGTPIITVTY